ncbi:MAG: hypothetical protein WDN26_23985 [Chitinophagaceae bacterium]
MLSKGQEDERSVATKLIVATCLPAGRCSRGNKKNDFYQKNNIVAFIQIIDK